MLSEKPDQYIHREILLVPMSSGPNSNFRSAYAQRQSLLAHGWAIIGATQAGELEKRTVQQD
jgi:hypothetical protein